MFPIRDDQPRYSTPYVNGFLIASEYFHLLLCSGCNGRRIRVWRMLTARQFGMVPAHFTAFLQGSPQYTFGQVVLPFFTSMFLHGGLDARAGKHVVSCISSATILKIILDISSTCCFT